MHDDRVSQSIYDRIPALIWLNVGLSLAMVVLALLGKHQIRWRLTGSAAAVFFVWLLKGVIDAAAGAGAWVV
jgi:hypothetical protein